MYHSCFLLDLNLHSIRFVPYYIKQIYQIPVRKQFQIKRSNSKQWSSLKISWNVPQKFVNKNLLNALFSLWIAFSLIINLFTLHKENWAKNSVIVFAFAQNSTAAAARVPIDNEQSKYFLFQLSFVSQSGGIPLSFLLSFHLYTFMQNISLFCILSCYFFPFRFFVPISLKWLLIKRTSWRTHLVWSSCFIQNMFWRNLNLKNMPET